jgi:hypothetical protein
MCVERNVCLNIVNCSNWRSWFGLSQRLSLKYNRTKVLFIDQIHCGVHSKLHVSFVSNLTLFHKDIYTFVMKEMKIDNKITKGIGNIYHQTKMNKSGNKVN